MVLEGLNQRQGEAGYFEAGGQVIHLHCQHSYSNLWLYVQGHNKPGGSNDRE